MYVLQSSFLYRSIFYLMEIVTSATIHVMVGSQVIAIIPVWYVVRDPCIVGQSSAVDIRV